MYVLREAYLFGVRGGPDTLLLACRPVMFGFCSFVFTLIVLEQHRGHEQNDGSQLLRSSFQLRKARQQSRPKLDQSGKFFHSPLWKSHLQDAARGHSHMYTSTQ